MASVAEWQTQLIRSVAVRAGQASKVRVLPDAPYGRVAKLANVRLLTQSKGMLTQTVRLRTGAGDPQQCRFDSYRVHRTYRGGYYGKLLHNMPVITASSWASEDRNAHKT